MTLTQQLALVLSRIDSTRGGILLFHDTEAQSAAMLPQFLRALKGRGYSVIPPYAGPALKWSGGGTWRASHEARNNTSKLAD